MAIEFTELVDPTTLDVSLALIIISILFISIWVSIRLRSIICSFMFMLMSIILIFTFVTNLEFIWFWGSVILMVISIFASSIEYYILDSR